MQNISAILCIKNGTAYWSHLTGGHADTPVFTLGILGTLTIDLRQAIPVGSEEINLPVYDPAELSGLALRFVIDVDYDQTTTPPLAVNNVTLSTGSSGETVLTIPIPDTNYVAMRTKLGVGQGIQFAGAVIGRNTSGKDVLYFEFPLVFRNNIDLDNAATEPDTEDPDWLPTIRANIVDIVSGMADDLKGDPGDPGMSAFDTWRAQEGNENGTEAEFLASIRGTKGDKGDKGDAGKACSLSVGTVTTLPAGSNANVEITGTAPNQIANFSIPRGAQGAGAVFAYNITSDANSANWHPTMLATDRYWRISIDNGVSWSIARPLEQASVAPVARFSKIAQATNPTWQTPTDQGDGTSLLPSNCIYFRIKVEGRPWTEPALVGIPRDATTYPGVSSVADMTSEQLVTWTATLKNDGGIRVAYAAPDETTGQQPDAEDADAWHATIQTGDCYIRFSSLYGALRHVWTVSGGELASLQVATTGPEWHDTPLEDDKYMKLSLDGGTSWYGYFKIAMDSDDLELVLDSTPTQGSPNGVTSGGVYAAIQAAMGGQAADLSNYYNKPQADTLLQTKANASHAHVPSDITGLAAALAAKQDTLPSGAAGKFLKKTANGVEWDTLSAMLDPYTVSPIVSMDNMATLWNDNVAFRGIVKTVIAVNSNTDDDKELLMGHIYCFLTFAEAWVWDFSEPAYPEPPTPTGFWTTEYHEIRLLDAEDYGHFAGEYTQSDGQWRNDAYKIVSKTGAGSSTSWFIVPAALDVSSMSAGDLASAIQRSSDPLDGMICDGMPGELSAHVELVWRPTGNLPPWRVHTEVSEGPVIRLLGFYQDITPCVAGTCPFIDPTDTITALQSRIAALEAFHFGTLTVSHTGTAPADAQWSVDSGTTWRDFGTSATLAPGSYTVTFKSVTGYTAPSSQSVTLTAGGTETVSVAYTVTPTTGAVTLTFSGTPPQGAAWTVDGNSYTSGQTATLEPGTYAITYASVTGYDSPSTPTSVTVAAGDTLSLSAEYTAQQVTPSADYTVSGASVSAMNGGYNLDSSKTGYGTTPVYAYGDYLMFKIRDDNDDYYWVIGLATSFNTQPSDTATNLFTCHVESNASTPPTSGWTGCTVTQGS